MNISRRTKLGFMIALDSLLAIMIFVVLIFGVGGKAPQAAAPQETGGSPSASDPVAVEQPTPPERVELTAYSQYIAVGSEMEIIASIQPEKASGAPLTWKSSDESVASVDGGGKLTALSRGETLVTAVTDNGVHAAMQVFVMNKGLVFLSPSRQTGNFYFNGKVSECEQAFKMSGFCMERLLAVGLEVYECPKKYKLEVRGELAAGMNSKCYIAIHTNAEGSESGTMAFYHRAMTDSVRLALAVYEPVAALTPDKDAGIKSGVKANGKFYKEIEGPYDAGVPSTLLEVDFHDREASGTWLLENAQPVGYAIADGIMKYMYEIG